MLRVGMVLPTATIAARSASSKSSPIQPTSPVELMSTPSTGSAFDKRPNENCEALTPIQSMSNSVLLGGVNGASSMMRVAVSIKFCRSTLLTNGKLREARRLHSITFKSLFFAKYCMLKGPLMLSSRAILRLIFLIRRTVSKYSFCGGKTRVASPE